MTNLILKRTTWMGPTLLAISFLSFAIIQLPPGDYLTSYITALEEAGEPLAEEQVQALRQRYELDRPFLAQYLLWLNNLSPFGFDRHDDGSYFRHPDTSFNWPRFKWPDLGFSFEWNLPVSELIGERILLTIGISIVTMLFTWALAIPIGIYSAVRQYSWGDYCFSVLGFIGIATPNFLLALIFITSPSKQTVPVAVSYLITGDVFRWGLIMAGSVAAAIPVMILYYLGQRFVVQGLAAGAVKG